MKQRKEKRRWGLILFIVLIMIGTSFSAFLYGGSPQSEVVKYNGIKFTRQPESSAWTAKISGKNIAFNFLPSEASALFVFNDSLDKLEGKSEIDFTSDLDDPYKESIALLQYQMGLILADYNVFVRKGFTTNNTFNIPVIKCSSATQNVPVIYFKYGNLTSIHSSDSCIIAEASSENDFVMARDRLLYGILGIVK